MMRWIVGTSIQIRFLILVIAAVLMAFGISQIRNMPVDVYPEFNPPMVEVQTEALGLPAAEVESLITVPMEADLLNGVAWLDQIYSESVAGLSSILLVFEQGTDPIRARQMVQERLTQAFALPNVSKPPVMLQPLSTTNRVMMVGLSSKELSLIDMGVLARWTITPRLMGVPGVANVAIWGQRDWQLQVLVDPELLQAEGVTLSQIIETTGESLWVSPLSFLEASSPGTAGWIDTPNQRLSIRHLLPISSAEDLANVTIVGSDGLLLGDVAEVVEDHQPLIGDAALSDGPGLLLVIEKFPGANTLEVTRGVETALEVMKPGLSGIFIDTTLFRQANYIELAANNLAITMLISVVLMLIVLGAFHFEWRSALISLIAIVISLATAVFILNLRGASMNVMVLAGLIMALAIVVDDAVVDMGNIVQRLRHHRQTKSEKSPFTVILEASLEMRGPLIFAILIILASILPVFFIPGLSGTFLQPLALSYVIAVLVSLGVALLLTPALSLFFLADAPFERRESPVVQWLQRVYRGILTRTVTASGRMLTLAIVIILIGLAVLPLIQISLLPELKQTELLIHWEGAPGTSRTEMNRIIAQASQELRSIDGVRNVGSHVGRAITGDQVVGINSAEIWVSLDPKAEFETTVAGIEEVVNGYPGLLHQVQAYQPKRMSEALLGAEKDIVVRIYGNEFEVLRSKAAEITQAMAGIRGIADIQTSALTEEPQVEIEVDLTAAERYLVKPGDVRRSATTLLSGLQVGNLYEEQKVFDVVVQGVSELRSSLTSIRDLLIDTPNGGHVRLGSVADVRISPSPVIIQRDAVSRYVDVTARVEGRSLNSVAAEINQSLRTINFPLEHHAEVLGDYTERQAAQLRILAFSVTSVIGIFLLLQAAYSSWRLALIAILTLPVALVGGLLAAFLDGGVLSLGSLFGFLTIIGIVVRNGLLMTNHYYHLQRSEGEAFGTELVVHGAGDRVAPILMSILTSTAALLPIILAGDIAGLEMIRPMAIVIVGGLVTTTVLNLLILPSLYLRYGSSLETELEMVAVPATD
jgi:CzcA family heavy metal efflux pump